MATHFARPSGRPPFLCTREPRGRPPSAGSPGGGGTVSCKSRRRKARSTGPQSPTLGARRATSPRTPRPRLSHAESLACVSPCFSASLSRDGGCTLAGGIRQHLPHFSAPTMRPARQSATIVRTGTCTTSAAWAGVSHFKAPPFGRSPSPSRIPWGYYAAGSLSNRIMANVRFRTLHCNQSELVY